MCLNRANGHRIGGSSKRTKNRQVKVPYRTTIEKHIIELSFKIAKFHRIHSVELRISSIMTSGLVERI